MRPTIDDLGGMTAVACELVPQCRGKLAEIVVAIHTGGELEDRYRWDVTAPNGERIEVKGGVTTNPHFGTNDDELRADTVIVVKTTDAGEVISASRFAAPRSDELLKHAALQGNRRTIKDFGRRVREGFDSELTAALRKIVEASRA